MVRDDPDQGITGTKTCFNPLFFTHCLKPSFHLEPFITLHGCKYLGLRIEGKLVKNLKLDMLSQMFGFKSIAQKLEHLTITFGNFMCFEVLKRLEKDLKEKLPKVHVVVLRERKWLAIIDEEGSLAIRGAA